MGIPTTYWQKAITGNVVKQDSATMLHAGDSNSAVNNLSLVENQSVQLQYGAKLGLATSPASSGNIGAIKTISAGPFSNLEAGKYIAKKLTSTIAGQSNTFLRSGAADVGLRAPVHKFYGYQRLNITSWDYVTGEATVGGAAGATVLASGTNGVTGKAADQAYGPPGELVYRTGKSTPTQDDFKSSTNP